MVDVLFVEWFIFFEVISQFGVPRLELLLNSQFIVGGIFLVGCGLLSLTAHKLVHRLTL